MTREELHRLVDALPEEAVEEAGRLIVQRLDPDQAWFWTRAWQEREREADAELSAGQGSVYASDEDFLAALDARTKPRDADT